MHFYEKAGGVTGQGQAKKTRSNYANILCPPTKGKHKGEYPPERDIHIPAVVRKTAVSRPQRGR